MIFKDAKIKSLILIIFSILYISATIFAQTGCDEECRIRTVKWRYYESELGFSTSFSFKRIALLGDSTAFILRKLYTEEELLQKERLTICLSILKESFSYPEDISRKIDRNPQNTLQLLTILKSKTRDLEIVKMIDATSKHIAKQTKKFRRKL